MNKMNLEDLVALCKRRGFIYPSSAIYGGLQGFFDYGPLGVELKNNIKNLWWKEIVHLRSDVYGLDSSIILNKQVLKHSGHEDTFNDILIDCKECKTRFRDDESADKSCPKCGSKNLSDAREFNLMMHVNLGPTQGVNGVLRPETAQGVFINFKHVVDSFSPNLPFGIAQIGKAFRNEITPRNFIFRVREFEQMELEFFTKKEDASSWFDYWVEQRVAWWKKIGVHNIQLLEQKKEELAHYSAKTTDIVFQFPHGLEELEGVANRQDFDLASHTKAQDQFEIKSKVLENKDSVDKLCMNVDGHSFIPYLVETSAGLDRGVLAVLTSAYCVEEIDGSENRIVLKLHPLVAPIKAAVIPLARNKPELVAKAEEIFMNLKQNNIFPIKLENGGNIGKCYRKHDEIGTPFCITIDFETLETGNVTVRDRDTMQQESIAVADLQNYLKAKLGI